MFDVIAIGTATHDVFLQSKAFKPLDPNIFKEGKAPSFAKASEGMECFGLGSKIEVEKPVFANGGGAVNAVVTFARQGLKTAVLCRVGDDEAGRSIWDELKKEAIHHWKINPPAGGEKLGTGYATILLSPNGERTILAYRGAAENLAHKEIPFAELKSRWLYVVPSRIDPVVMEKLVEHCFYQGVSIAMNPSKFYLEKGAKNLKPFLDKIKVLILNKEEAAYMIGKEPSFAEATEGKREIFKKLDELVKGIAIMTDGPRGVWVSDGKKIYQAGIFKERKITDRTGAGDAFGSGFVAGLIMKEDIEYAIRLASANATSVVEAVGAHTTALTRNQFEKERRWGELEIKIHEN